MKERIFGIAGCFLDLACQIYLTFRGIFRKDPEWDVTDKIYHEDHK